MNECKIVLGVREGGVKETRGVVNLVFSRARERGALSFTAERIIK